MDFHEASPRNIRRVREWLTLHPDSDVKDVAEGVFPGKMLGECNALAALHVLRSRCAARVSDDGEKWSMA